mmetsp:Transcript_20983/g.65970  ORF Transcript_20983/g.65970 Transcript_20983/m.65970 type:complete len:170 (+) Transcript_20983:25-534(+)
MTSTGEEASRAAMILSMPEAVRRCSEWRQRTRPARSPQGSSHGVSAVFASDTAFGKPPPRIVYKAVAIDRSHGRERYYSIYAGKRVEYKLGEAARDPKGETGLFCYEDMTHAQRTKVPASAKMRASPRAVLECRPVSSGQRARGDKLRFDSLVPIRRMDVEVQVQPRWR